MSSNCCFYRVICLFILLRGMLVALCMVGCCGDGCNMTVAAGSDGPNRAKTAIGQPKTAPSPNLSETSEPHQTRNYFCLIFSLISKFFCLIFSLIWKFFCIIFTLIKEFLAMAEPQKVVNAFGNVAIFRYNRVFMTCLISFRK